MPDLQSLIDHALPEPRTLFGVAAFLLLIHPLVKCASAHRRSKRLGHKPVAVAHWAPFGIDVLATAISRLRNNDFFNCSRHVFDASGRRTVAMRMLGVEVLMTDDTDNIKAVLSTKFSQYVKGRAFHKIWYDLMFDSVFTRSFCGITQVAKIRPTDLAIMEKHTAAIIRNLSDGKPHECLDQMDRLSLDVVSDVFFGESAGSLSQKTQPLRAAVEEMYLWNMQRLLLGNLGTLLPGTPKASAVLVDYLDHVIDKAKSAFEGLDGAEKDRREHTMLGSLISQNISRKRIKDQMMAILLGGKDPAPITVVWALYELARHPHIVRELRAEIGLTLGFSALPTAQQLKSMPRLQNIVKETLRLHTPIGFNIRTALTDTYLPTGGGPTGEERIAVLKGTHVALSYIGTQRRHDLIGPTADDFDPSRWETWTPKLYEFIPFNHGPRVCLGRNFALLFMEYVLCRIFQEFESVELAGENAERLKGAEEVGIQIALNTKPAEPIALRFYRGQE